MELWQNGTGAGSKSLSRNPHDEPDDTLTDQSAAVLNNLLQSQVWSRRGPGATESGRHLVMQSLRGTCALYLTHLTSLRFVSVQLLWFARASTKNHFNFSRLLFAVVIAQEATASKRSIKSPLHSLLFVAANMLCKIFSWARFFLKKH